MKTRTFFLIHCLNITTICASLKSLLNVDSPIFLLPEDQRGIEFGFSLSLFANSTHRNVLVGSPLANTSQAGVTSPGALYSCDISNLQRTEIYCSQLTVDTRDKDDKYISFIDEDIKDFQRLGGSLSTGDNHVVVCAPNWHYYERRVRATNDAPVGMCFKSSNLNNFEPFSVPYDQNADVIVIDYLNVGSCQSGFSSTLTKENKMILGSPGCYNWEGDVYTQTKNDDFLSFGKGFTAKDFGGTDDRESLGLPNMYMGYSVASGIFKGVNGVAVGMPKSSQLKKAINSTYGENPRVMNPMVNIHTIEDDELKLWTTLTPPKNDEGYFDSVWLFSYFGYSVAIADVDGNKLDDVIVGAPFFHNRTSFDQGAILIYLQVKEERENASDIYYMFLEEKPLRTATYDYGRFGSSVVNVGDLDANGIEDIAVGAPYGEDGRVFIYLGTLEGLSERPYQTLSSTDTTLQGRNLKGFGSSFAPSFQVEKGTQTDMAIGAFISDTAVLFTSKVMIDVKWDVKFPNKMDLSSTCQIEGKFLPCTEIVTCFSYSFLEQGKKGDTRPKGFELSHDLDINSLPKRLFFDDFQTFRAKYVVVEFEKVTCDTQKVYTNRQINDLDAFEILSFIKHKPSGIRDRSTLQTQQKTSTIEILEIHIDCKSLNVSECISDLHLQSKQSTDTLQVEDARFSILYEITNFGETSYSNKIELSMDPYLEISGKAELENGSTISPTIDCRSTGEGKGQCSLGTFINTDDVLKFSLSFVATEEFLQIEHLRKHDIKFVVESSLRTLSEIKFSDAATTTTYIALETNPEVYLTKNESSTDFVTYDKDARYSYPSELAEGEVIGPSVVHIYEIYNKMPYVIENNFLNIYWPYKIDGVELLVGDVKLSASNIFCNTSLQAGFIKGDGKNISSFGKIVWKSVSCDILYLKPQESVDVKLDLALVMKTLIKDVYNPEVDEIRSYATLVSSPVLLGLKSKQLVSNDIRTGIDYGDFVFRLFPIWAIIVAVVVAILILIIIAFILYKYNFFQRKKGISISAENLEGEATEDGEEMQTMVITADDEEIEQYDNI